MNVFDIFASIYGFTPGYTHGPSVHGPWTRQQPGRASAPGLLTRVVRLVGRGVAAYRRHAAARTAYHELSRLNDRALKDIGISRAEIPYLVAHLTRAKPANENRPVKAA
jgi:uncharacterized protein YjiS (DUF1127 family)